MRGPGLAPGSTGISIPKNVEASYSTTKLPTQCEKVVFRKTKMITVNYPRNIGQYQK